PEAAVTGHAGFYDLERPGEVALRDAERDVAVGPLDPGVRAGPAALQEQPKPRPLLVQVLLDHFQAGRVVADAVLRPGAPAGQEAQLAEQRHACAGLAGQQLAGR